MASTAEQFVARIERQLAALPDEPTFEGELVDHIAVLVPVEETEVLEAIGAHFGERALFGGTLPNGCVRVVVNKPR